MQPAGLRRRRVRVKTRPSRGGGAAGSGRSMSRAAAIPTSAPLLSPGTYDAETLLRHRARAPSFGGASSSSGAGGGTGGGSTQEEMDAWIRSGAEYARVVKTPGSSGAAGPAGTGKASGEGILDNAAEAQAELKKVAKNRRHRAASSTEEEDDDDEEEEEDPRDNFARVQGVGVEGPLGFDTEDDAESDWGEGSPTNSRRSSDAGAGLGVGGRRRAGSGSRASLGFTPMSSSSNASGQ